MCININTPAWSPNPRDQVLSFGCCNVFYNSHVIDSSLTFQTKGIIVLTHQILSRIAIQRLESSKVNLQNSIAKEVVFNLFIKSIFIYVSSGSWHSWFQMYLLMHRQRKMQFCKKAWKDESKLCLSVA